jgi:hypothetical protein
VHNECDVPESDLPNSRQARRQSMREAGIPTSQALHPDKASKSVDKVYLTRDKKNVVMDAKNDESHLGQPHWEAGKTKTNQSNPEGFERAGTGKSNSNKPQIKNGSKSKVYYR